MLHLKVIQNSSYPGEPLNNVNAVLDQFRGGKITYNLDESSFQIEPFPWWKEGIHFSNNDEEVNKYEALSWEYFEGRNLDHRKKAVSNYY